MKNQIGAIAVSALLHMIVFILLFVYSDSSNKQDYDKVSIITINSVKSGDKVKNSVKTINSENKKTIIKENTVEKVSEEKNIGNSDVESILHARAPQNESERYLLELRNQIAEQQIYPLASKALGEEGSVKIRLTLKKNGDLIKIEVFDPSPFARLNDAAIKAVSRAAPFKPFPLEVSFDLWQITLPIRYTLSKS